MSKEKKIKSIAKGHFIILSKEKSAILEGKYI